MNRPVAVAAANMEAVNAAHANVIQERKERRGNAALAPVAAGFAGAGFGGPGGGAGEPSLLMGVSRH